MTVRFEFPCGEIFTLAPLVALGIVPSPEIDPKGIGKKERWTAQGLEGKAFIEIEEGLADILLKRIGKNRCRIVASSAPLPVMPRGIPPIPTRLE